MKDHSEGGWKYTPPTKESIAREKNKRGGDYDHFVEAPTWSVKEGEHRVRILPATWPDPQHFGYELWVHYGIGADNQSYLCANKMKEEPCILCKHGQKATRRLAYWIIDRSDEKAGPKVWVAGWTINRDICGIMKDDNGDTLCVDALKKGYDLNFARTGTDMDNTKYHSFLFNRSPSPISDDPETYAKWKQYIIDNPIPSVLRYFPDDRIMRVFNGGAVEPEAPAEEAPPKTRTAGTRAAIDSGEDDPPPAKPKAAPVEDDDDTPPPPKKRAQIDEDDDTPPPPKKAKPVPVEDDEEEEPTPKPKTNAVREAARKAAADLDDDEEEAPPPKPKAKPAPVEDDDE